jgi:trehalose 6-phosphate synthase
MEHVPLLEGDHEPQDVFRYLRSADLCYVASLQDGMNLVSKEFVSAKEDERGVLILSKFAGAASELRDALLVNPWDIDGTADALARALRMTEPEQRRRMRNMRSRVARFSAHRWAEHMLADAVRVRRASRSRGRTGAQVRAQGPTKPSRVDAGS